MEKDSDNDYSIALDFFAFKELFLDKSAFKNKRGAIRNPCIVLKLKRVRRFVNSSVPLLQENNPEVRVDISRPDVYINEQIFSLKLITKKIENAHKGQNIDYPHSNGAKSKLLFVMKARIELNLLINVKLFPVFMSDKAESSGDGCDPDSDDEDDCNDDDR